MRRRARCVHGCSTFPSHYPSSAPAVSSYAGSPSAARPGETAGTLRLLAYLALAIVLLVLDHRGGWMATAREYAARLAQPMWSLAGLPGRVGGALQDGFAARGTLIAENRRLRNEVLVANARLTRLRNAAVDNAQLRELLGVSERRGLDVQLVPVLDVDLEPSRQRLLLSAGSRQGVQRGQAVIDAGGLLGQVVAVTPGTATVLLLTDPDHAVPVMVARNGVRLIVYGRGDRLELRDVPLNRDVQVGDALVTSGLGGRFPPGFPVATIAGLHPDESQAFLVGELDPAAQLDRGRDVLLLRPGAVPDLPPPVQPGDGGATATDGDAAAAAQQVPAPTAGGPGGPQAAAPASAGAPAAPARVQATTSPTRAATTSPPREPAPAQTEAGR